MHTEIYLAVLMALSVVALILTLTVFLQTVSAQAARNTYMDASLAETAPTTRSARSTPKLDPADTTATESGGLTTPLQMFADGQQLLTEREQLRLITSVFREFHYRADGLPSSTAAKTLPLLTNEMARVSERIHLGRYRLEQISKGHDTTAATHAAQALATLSKVELLA